MGVSPAIVFSNSRRWRKATVFTLVAAMLLLMANLKMVTYPTWQNRFSESPSRIRPYRIAVWDNKKGHDEVVLPALWNLQQLPNVTIDLFRDNFRPGASETLSEWFSGKQFKHSQLIEQNMLDYDAIFLTTGHVGSGPLFDTGILERYPHLKVVSIVHRIPFYMSANLAESSTERNKVHPLSLPDIENIKRMIHAKRWSFLCLSPHVANHFFELLSSHVQDISLATITQTFVPVMPVVRDEAKRNNIHRPFTASIVGRVTVSRDYGRIFSQLKKARKRQPKFWQGASESKVEVGNKSEKAQYAFELFTLGETASEGRLSVPRELTTLVRTSGRVSQSEFSHVLSSTDAVIPAFRNHYFYTKQGASGAIPAAVMARVPVLVDKEELDAYSYLRAPAYILRDEGEDEIAAITRIRQDRQKEPAGRINDSAAWKKYEDQLYKNNSIVLAQALGIRLS